MELLCILNTLIECSVFCTINRTEHFIRCYRFTNRLLQKMNVNIRFKRQLIEDVITNGISIFKENPNHTALVIGNRIMLIFLHRNICYRICCRICVFVYLTHFALKIICKVIDRFIIVKIFKLYGYTKVFLNLVCYIHCFEGICSHIKEGIVITKTICSQFATPQVMQILLDIDGIGNRCILFRCFLCCSDMFWPYMIFCKWIGRQHCTSGNAAMIILFPVHRCPCIVKHMKYFVNAFCSCKIDTD